MERDFRRKNPAKIRALRIPDIFEAAGLLVEAGLCERKSLVKRLRWLAKHHRQTCYVAKSDGKLVGVLLACYTGFHVFLVQMAVASGTRGKRIGLALHNRLLRSARKLGAKGIIVDSWLSSVGFYYKLNYRMPGVVFLINNFK
jgi:predicted N-acetyltransferase YhbS